MHSYHLSGLRLWGSAILLVVAADLCFPVDAASDDGWRRTAQGWEQMQPIGMETPILTAPRMPRPLSPLLHPLLLASIQAGVVVAAYWRHPVKAKDLCG